MDCVCAAVRRASRAITQLYDAVLEPTGLKATQFIILKAILDTGGIAQCDFARWQNIAVETLSRRFASLRNKGYLDVRIGRRSERIYKLTDDGKRRVLEALPYWQRAQERLRIFLGDDWDKVVELLSRVPDAAMCAERLRTGNSAGTTLETPATGPHPDHPFAGSA